MKIDSTNKLFYFLCSLSLFIELYFNIDSAGSGGSITDFNSTWPLVENPLNFSTDLDIKFPLHYYIAAIIYKIFNDKEILRFIYCLLALCIPYLFFLCLKIKYKEIKVNNLFLFSLIIFLLPSVRSAAIWPNTQITGIIFFLFSLLFFVYLRRFFHWFRRFIRSTDWNHTFEWRCIWQNIFCGEIDWP